MIGRYIEDGSSRKSLMEGLGVEETVVTVSGGMINASVEWPDGTKVVLRPLPNASDGVTQAETTEQRFRRLASRWRAETAFVSSSAELVDHPAFKDIVSLGEAVVPLLLRELENGTGHWHRALRRITGDDPVPESDRGNIEVAVQSWLAWGEEHGYEW